MIMNPILSVIFILITTFFSSTIFHISASSNPLAPALYVFGDSLFDSGNNNLLPTIAKANYLPYGVDFPQGVTGRFTNGKTVADFIAEYLGLPYSPPYLSIRLFWSSTPTGLNYASGSCGILPITGSKNGKCLNIEEQIDLFETTIRIELKGHFENNDQLSQYLSKSIFIFSVGNNDYINNYLESSTYASKNDSADQSFAQLLVDKLALQFERLYKLGARKLIMFELGPIGCLPSITRDLNDGTKCVDRVNKVISYFNTKLGPMLSNLTSTLQGSIFALGHAHWLGYDVIQNPSKYGLMDSKNPCCEAWFNGTSGCIPFLQPCDKNNRNGHFFWDAFHLTESACSLIATRCIDDPSVCKPTINQLLAM